jgi:MEMO1 family protein
MVYPGMHRFLYGAGTIYVIITGKRPIMDGIREPAVSGTFYPSNPDVLRSDIDGYLSKAPDEKIPGSIAGLISPHAGYMYSGQTAAYGYKTLVGAHYDTVIIVGPSHQSFFVGVAAYDKGAFRTPLGLVPIDEELSGELIGRADIVHSDPRVHRGEHAIEVQLPFLQTVLGSFELVPLIMGTSQDPESSVQLATLIYDCIKDKGKRYLIMGSTDLSHYYPYDLAVEIDKAAIGLIKAFDVQGLIRDLPLEKYEACGAGPFISTMMVCEKLGAGHSKVLKYANSGDVTGDKSGVVGYVSCVFHGE